MAKVFIMFFVCCMILNFKMHAQQTILIPQQYEDKLTSEKDGLRMDFFAYPYDSDLIDLRDLRRRFPGSELPSNIQIKAPDINVYQDVTVLMTVLPKEGKRKELLIIWLVGNYRSNKAYFMIDTNLDGDFRNDGKPMVVRGGQKSNRIELKPKNKDGEIEELLIEMPRHPDFVKQKIKQLKGVKAKMGHKIVVGFHAGFGVGNMKYDYDNLTTGFPTWYSVNMSEKNIGLSTGYTHPYFRVDVDVSYQNVYYYTSYLNIQRDEPELRLNPNTGRYITVQNVDTRRNLDTHDRHRFQLGLTGAARIQLGTYSELQPYVSLGRMFFSSGEYKLRESAMTSVYSHKPAAYTELGMRFEFTVGIYRSFFIETGWGNLNWRPENFFESVPHENLNVKYGTWKMTLGYRIGL